MGTSAIFQIIYEIGKLMMEERGTSDQTPLAAAVLIAGPLITHLTGLLVVTYRAW